MDFSFGEGNCDRELITGSLYKEIFISAPTKDLSGIWKSKIPAKIKIFLWQTARNRIPSGDQMRKQHGPGDCKCPWCRMDEDSDHILIRCIVARFTWNVVREVTRCDWNPSGFANLYRLIQNMSARDARLAWIGVGTMSWVMWNARNKALIEGIVFTSG